MYHLDVVASTVLANPVTAGLTESLGSGFLEDFLDCRPSSVRTTGHERGTVTSTLLTTGDTGTNEEEALLLKLGCPANRIGVMGVSTVDDNVTSLEMGGELVDEGVYSRAGLDEEDDLTGGLQLCAELLNGMCALDVGTYAGWCNLR